MLKIGQEVYIRREPYDGEEYYEFNGDDYARIDGLVAYGDEVLCQLDCHDDHCLWCMDDLEANGDSCFADGPAFNVHDEVFVTGSRNVYKIHAIYRGLTEYLYLFTDQGPDPHVGIAGTCESELTLYRKHGETVDGYTLF